MVKESFLFLAVSVSCLHVICISKCFDLIIIIILDFSDICMDL